MILKCYMVSYSHQFGQKVEINPCHQITKSVITNILHIYKQQ